MSTRRWFSSRAGDQGPARMPGICTLRVAITDRWTLRVFKKRALHHDAEALAAWAAAKLADDLPKKERLEPALPEPALAEAFPDKARN